MKNINKRATIRVVAEEANVSIATVSRVINNIGTVTEENREKVINAIEKVKYYSNTTASNLKRNKSNVIGIVIPTLTNSYFMELIKGIEDQLQDKNYVLYIASSNEDSKYERRILQKLFENNTEVLVIATTGENDEFVRELSAMGQKVVAIDRRLTEGERFSFVGEDNFQTSYQLAKYFFSNNSIKNVVIVGGILHLSLGRKRKLGAEKAAREYEYDPIFFDGGYTAEGGKKVISKIVKQYPQGCGIISLNNAMTSGMIDYLYSHLSEMERNKYLIASYGRIDLQKLFKKNIKCFVEQYPYQIGVEGGKLIQQFKDTGEVFEEVRYISSSILKEE